MTLDDLRKDFYSKYPNLDYFTASEILNYMDMAYCIGVDNLQDDRIKSKFRPVIRDDGVPYKSVSYAARRNKVTKQSIITAMRNNYKCAGYKWRYA